MNSERTTPGTDAAGSEARRTMPREVRETLSWLAHLIDDELPVRAGEDADAFAGRHLGAEPHLLYGARQSLTSVTASLVGRVLARDMKRHPPLEISAVDAGGTPEWARLEVDAVDEMVPSELVTAFAAGTIADAPIVVTLNAAWQPRWVSVRSTVPEQADAYLADVLERASGADNFMRGRCLSITDNEHPIEITVIPSPASRRTDLVLPDQVWTEIDLNVRSLFDRRALLAELGLGGNRGVLISGPPGTGKSALCGVLAAELAGSVTVAHCSARALGGHLRTVYDEIAALTPALVILEDIDLIVTRRGGGRDGALHDFLGALDGAMSAHDGIVTLATTNEPQALDEAAVRSARFDRVIDIPLPDVTLRDAILRRYLGRLATSVDVALVARTTDGASGADLRELVQRAVLHDGDALSTSTFQAILSDTRWAVADTGLYL